MPVPTQFRPYGKWRKEEGDRAEDAAYVFAFYMMLHCRTEAMETIPGDTSPDTRKTCEKAVDTALHNMMDLLEGYWRTPADDSHEAEFALNVNILDKEQNQVESQAISPGKLDLPIGYWAWRAGQFG